MAEVPGDYLPRRVTDDTVRRIELGPRHVSCLVTGRWLEFDEDAEFVQMADQCVIRLDVMTTTWKDERRWKICELYLGVDDLRRALDEVVREVSECEDG